MTERLLDFATEMTATGSTYMALEIAGLRQLLAERAAEIERLQATLEAIDDHGRAGSFVETLKAKDKLITELADALEIHSSTYPGAPIEKLIQRAREATKK